MNIQTNEQLRAKRCMPCEGGVAPCSLDFSKAQLVSLPGWEITDDGRMISRKWKLQNFVEAMKLINAAADVAEQDQHHPDMHLTRYREVRIDLTTHAISGLSENDFILASKIDAATKQLP